MNMGTAAAQRMLFISKSKDGDLCGMRVRFINQIKKWGLSVIAILLGGLVILLMLAFFNISTEKSMETFIHSNMEEQDQTAILSLNNSFDDFSSMLELQAEIFGMLDHPADEDIMKKLAAFAEAEGFKNAAIATFDGRVYSSFRGITRARAEDEFPNLYKKETTISQPRIFHDGTLVIDISTPVKLNGAEAGKLVVSLGSDYISRMFTSNILQGDAALNLIAEDGTVIMRASKRPSPLKPKGNVFDFYSGRNLQFVESSLKELTHALDKGGSTWVRYKYGGSNVCALFMPFGRNNWYMAIAATQSTLHAQSLIIQKNVFRLTIGIMLIVTAASVIVIIQRLREQRRLDALRNTYSIAIRKTNDLFYEADIDSDDFIDYSEQKDKTVWKETPKNYSNALKQVAQICAPECRQQFLDTFLPQNIKIKMKEGISSINFEYKITPDENTVRWLSATFVPVEDGSGGTKLICMENDITEHMLRQEILNRSATRDGLTGLYNKITTRDYIDWFLEGEGKNGDHALAIIDIDCFKSVNDALGHAKGDEVLSEFAASLKKIFRKSDIIGRIGGDEFIVFLKGYGAVELITAKMNHVIKSIHKEYRPDGDEGKTVRTSASIGIALYKTHGENFEQLYKTADLALYKAKSIGKNTYVFFTPDFTKKEIDQ